MNLRDWDPTCPEMDVRAARNASDQPAVRSTPMPDRSNHTAGRLIFFCFMLLLFLGSTVSPLSGGLDLNAPEFVPSAGVSQNLGEKPAFLSECSNLLDDPALIDGLKALLASNENDSLRDLNKQPLPPALPAAKALHSVPLPPQSAQSGQQGCKLFLGSLPPEATTEEIRIFFLTLGVVVEEVHLMGGSAAQRRSRSGNACAFVRLSDPFTASKMIEVLRR